MPEEGSDWTSLISGTQFSPPCEDTETNSLDHVPHPHLLGLVTRASQIPWALGVTIVPVGRCCILNKAQLPLGILIHCIMGFERMNGKVGGRLLGEQRKVTNLGSRD